MEHWYLHRKLANRVETSHPLYGVFQRVRSVYHTCIYTHTHMHCMSDGSLGSLHRWRSQRIAKCWSCELQDTLALFGLRNTLLTERLYRLADLSSCPHVDCSALGWECFIRLHAFICIYTYFFLPAYKFIYARDHRKFSTLSPINSVALYYTQSQ